MCVREWEGGEVDRKKRERERERERRGDVFMYVCVREGGGR